MMAQIAQDGINERTGDCNNWTKGCGHVDTKNDWTDGCGHCWSLDNYPGTLGAFSAFSFLTRSPCMVTRVKGQEEASGDDVVGAGAEVGGVMPGL